MSEFKNNIESALKYVQEVIDGLEREPTNINKVISDEITRLKALHKIERKMIIFETLEAICEDALEKLKEQPTKESSGE